MKNSCWKKWIFGVLLGILVSAAAMLALAIIFTGDTIRKGIRIEQTDVSWLSTNEAKKQVAADIGKSFCTDRIRLIYGSRQCDVLLKDIGYGYSVDETVERAFSIGRRGSLPGKVYVAMRLLLDNLQLNLETSYDRSVLRGILGEIEKECDVSEKNAEIHYKKGNIMIVPEVTGTGLDVDKNLELVDNHLKNRDFNPVELQLEYRKPHIVYDKISEIDSIVSSFSTRFNAGDTNRSDNIRLACSRLDGRILLPGEEFSMNEALGPRTLENGYKEAPVILKDELIPGTGGGVCQVSSTLYNSILLAGLEVTERVHHSIPLTYISPGRDATINEGSIDFRFANNLDYAVCLQAGVAGNKVSIRILGRKKTDGTDIRLKTETLAVYQPDEDEIIPDDSLRAGEKEVERKAVKGVRVALYKETYKNGNLISSEKMSEDYYKPVRGKIRVSRDLYDTYKSIGKGIVPVE